MKREGRQVDRIVAEEDNAEGEEEGDGAVEAVGIEAGEEVAEGGEGEEVVVGVGLDEEEGYIRNQSQQLRDK